MRGQSFVPSLTTIHVRTLWRPTKWRTRSIALSIQLIARCGACPLGAPTYAMACNLTGRRLSGLSMVGRLGLDYELAPGRRRRLEDQLKSGTSDTSAARLVTHP
jgi:hypothetical protein